MFKRRLLGLFTLLVLAVPAMAQVRLTATIAQPIVSQGTPFRVTYQFNSQGGNFQRPDFSPFRIVQGPHVGQSTQIIGGQVTHSLTISFDLLATGTGSFKIPPAAIRGSDGKTYESNSLKVEVVRAGASSVPQQPGTSTPLAESKENSEIFLRAVPDKSTVYLGEPILVTFKIYLRIDFRQPQIRKLPAFNGFWTESYDNSGQAVITQEQIGGERYNVAEVKKFVLFPQRTGELTIEPMEMEFIVRRKGRTGHSFFDQFFNAYEEELVEVASPPLNIRVSALPEPRPESFYGAVGQFSLSSSLERDSLQANDATRLKITVSGTGNHKLIETPEIEFHSDIEHYAPVVDDKMQLTPRGMSGSRTWEYLLIPRHNGRFIIPSFDFTYFDTRSNSYKTLSADSFQLNVSRNDGDSYSEAEQTRRELKKLGEDIRYIREEPGEFQQKVNLFAGSLSYFASLSLPLIAFTIFLFIVRRQERDGKDKHGFRFRKALRTAKIRLKSAEKLKDSKSEYLEKLNHALYGFMADKFRISESLLNRDLIRIKLQDKKVTPDLINRYMTLLDEAEFARFAPTSVMPGEDLVSRAQKLVEEMDRQLK